MTNPNSNIISNTNSTNPTSCPVCKLSCNLGSESIIKCSFCSNPYHISCSKVSKKKNLGIQKFSKFKFHVCNV